MKAKQLEATAAPTAILFGGEYHGTVLCSQFVQEDRIEIPAIPMDGWCVPVRRSRYVKIGGLTASGLDQFVHEVTE